MRCFQRVARSAAPFRDRPAGAMRSALVGAAPSLRRHAHPGSLNSEPLAEIVTRGSASQFAERARERVGVRVRESHGSGRAVRRVQDRGERQAWPAGGPPARGPGNSLKRVGMRLRPVPSSSRCTGTPRWVKGSSSWCRTSGSRDRAASGRPRQKPEGGTPDTAQCNRKLWRQEPCPTK